MKNNDINSLLLEYLEGGLTTDREKVLKSILIKHGYKIDELDTLREIWRRLDDISIPQASEKMTENFYRMLNSYKRDTEGKHDFYDNLIIRLRQSHFQRLMVRVASGVVLLFVGWSLGFWFTSNEQYEERLDYMSSEIRQMKEMIVLAELNQPSPNERIKAINQIKAYGTVDERTIAMLFNVLSGDSNANVRLIALEALVMHADRTSVRQGLIQSLDRQESPLVQLALTDAIVRLKEKQAVGQLRKMLERKDLNHVVRTKIVNSLSLLM